MFINSQSILSKNFIIRMSIIFLGFMNIQGMGTQKYLIKHQDTTDPKFIATATNCGNRVTYTNSPVTDNQFNPINNNIFVISLFGENLSKLTSKELYENILSTVYNTLKMTFEWASNNKKMAAAGILGSIYIIINSRLIYLHSKLKSSNCWSLWRSNLTIEELYFIPRQTLYNDLLTNIRMRYINFKNFKDNLAPLSNFLESVEKEEDYIKQYERIIKILKNMHITGIFFYSHDLFKQLKKRSSRLLFLKSAFLNWYSERNLNNPEKELLVRRFPKVKDLLNDNSNSYELDISPEESIDVILEQIVVI